MRAADRSARTSKISDALKAMRSREGAWHSDRPITLGPAADDSGEMRVVRGDCHDPQDNQSNAEVNPRSWHSRFVLGARSHQEARHRDRNCEQVHPQSRDVVASPERSTRPRLAYDPDVAGEIRQKDIGDKQR